MAKKVNIGKYTRTMRQREVIFVCTGCGQTVTQLRYPSPKPLYCSGTCKGEARKEKTRLRVQQLRFRRKEAKTTEYHRKRGDMETDESQRQ